MHSTSCENGKCECPVTSRTRLSAVRYMLRHSHKIVWFVHQGIFVVYRRCMCIYILFQSVEWLSSHIQWVVPMKNARKIINRFAGFRKMSTTSNITYAHTQRRTYTLVFYGNHTHVPILRYEERQFHVCISSCDIYTGDWLI